MVSALFICVLGCFFNQYKNGTRVLALLIYHVYLKLGLTDSPVC